MRALIVHAHPEPTSFTSALRRTAETTLRELGHEVQVSDLHAEGFDPVAGRHDFVTVADPERFHYQSEQRHAAQYDGFAADIAREQERVAASDLFVFTFPIWWGGPPAILKGWFDRVMAYGFAYEDGMRFDTGFLRGRSALMGIVTGGTPPRFSADGTYGDINQVLWPVRRCMLEYLGLDAPDPFVAYAAPRMDDGARADYLAAWRRQLTVAASTAEALRGSRPDLPRPTTVTDWSSPA
ncbi:NAD(P)H-dependent oxidoreductase [Micromonospora sp. ATA32]|nr:NAD(P)H-dependent oxidoreductase [Micromonospora sp. ATA32]